MKELVKTFSFISVQSRLEAIFRNNVLIVAVISVIATLYLGYINFNSAFFTLDDFSYAMYDRRATWDSILETGRISQLIGMLIGDFLGFKVPTYASLSPRLFSLLFVFFTLATIFIRVGVEIKHSFFYALFIICTHQIDWQHNGLVAFFGSYNIYFSLFFLGIILDDDKEKNMLRWISIFLLMFFSFTSELFVGGAFVYLIFLTVLKTPISKLLKSPISWAFILYIILFFVGQQLVSPETSASMKHYMMGNVSQQNIGNLIYAGLLYFTYSLPFLNTLQVDRNLSMAITGLIFLPVLLVLLKDAIKHLFILYTEKQTNQKEKYPTRTPILLLAMVIVIGVTPQFLLAMQPMKFDWIMTNSMTRYAFSLYGWFAISIPLFFYMNKILARYKKIDILMIFIMATMICYTVQSNIAFLQPYKQSRLHWIDIYNEIKATEGDNVTINSRWMSHPYILPMSEAFISSYVSNLSGKKAVFCYYDNGRFTFSYKEPDIIKLAGFEFPEPNGRWASNAAEFTILHDFAEGGKVEVFFNGGFNFYDTNPITITYGTNTYYHIPKVGSSFEVLLEPGASNPTIKLIGEHASSPYALGLSNDKRNLSTKVKAVSAYEFNDGNLINIFTCE